VTTYVADSAVQVQDGFTARILHRGAVLPSGIAPAVIEHLLAYGLIHAVSEPKASGRRATAKKTEDVPADVEG